MWQRLCVKDDWGTQYYALHKYKNAMSSYREQAVSLPERVKIRWPDGTTETVTRRYEAYTEHINDMGHEYTVSGKMAVFTTEIRGVKQTVRFDKVEVWLP